jgi:hypothetical protein
MNLGRAHAGRKITGIYILADRSRLTRLGPEPHWYASCRSLPAPRSGWTRGGQADRRGWPHLQSWIPRVTTRALAEPPFGAVIRSWALVRLAVTDLVDLRCPGLWTHAGERTSLQGDQERVECWSRHAVRQLIRLITGQCPDAGRGRRRHLDGGAGTRRAVDVTSVLAGALASRPFNRG